MASVGKKLRSAVGTNDRRLLHWCPACKEPHGIRIKGGPPVWTFDENYDAPTFGPSIRCFTIYDEDGEPLPAGTDRTLCHYFIKAGKIEFCGDNPHALNGQTVDLPDWPYERGKFSGIEE